MKPTRAVMRGLWEDRGGKRGLDVAVAVVHGDRVTVFGPDAEAQPVELAIGLARRQLQAVLDEPDSGSAWDRLGDLRRSAASSGIGGVTNTGLFAKHYLDTRVSQRSDWAASGSSAATLLPLRGEQLITALGYSVRKEGGAVLLTGASGAPRAVAVLLDESETFDGQSPKHQLSPIAFGLREANQHDVDWLIALRDDRIRLYAGRTGVGVGQKGQTETYFEVDLAAVDDEHAALLPLVFSAAALDPRGSTRQILEDSARYATNLGSRLRDRIYLGVVPRLAAAVAAHLPEMGLQVDQEGLRTAYRVTLRILFRLLFQAYAEDRGLLPAGRNERYDANSLKTAAQRDLHTDPAEFGDSTTLWSDLEQVWDAIDQGNAQWMVPAYNGGLFNRTCGEGAMIARLRLPDSVMGPALQALLVDVNEDDDRGPVDFSSLSVREFGTIYEGLLESSLSLAETDLTYDKDDYPVPAGTGDRVDVPAGSAYFHSASGERKATGSYFTPAIVVDHLIERSIVPVLGRHLDHIRELLESGDEVAAGREFFDFRVADLAMGSGHFLIAAIDRVESMYRDFLTLHRIPRVEEELLRIHGIAVAALGRDRAAVDQVENVGLLRRQVARRCIYGIDVNPLALELSRLALWIHTFVPGLPMSSFDHNLVCANSLTGIGTEQEAIDALEPDRPPGQASFLDDVIDEALAGAKTLLIDAANADEADKASVQEGARLRSEARIALEPIRKIFDLAVAIRTGLVKPIMVLDAADLADVASDPAVQEGAEQLHPAHMPYLFPEVFLRDRPGFDVLLGNPPWEELVYEEVKFWTLQFPGLKGNPVEIQKKLVSDYRAARPDLLAQMTREKNSSNAMRRNLATGPYPGLEKGHADLYKAFAWRYLTLLRDGGAAGVVLPRTATSALGSGLWRRAVAEAGRMRSVTTLLNSGRWVFSAVDGRYSIALVIIERGNPGHTELKGPFNSADAFIAGNDRPGVMVSSRDLGRWSESFAVPLLPEPDSGTVFLRIRTAPNFEDGAVQSGFMAVQGDFNQTTDANLWDVGYEKLPLKVMKGASFDLWDPDAGRLHGSADRASVKARVASKLMRQTRLASSAFFGMNAQEMIDTGTLPFEQARIAFRDITNQTNSRTVVTALVPPETVLINSAPFLVRRGVSRTQEAYRLGVLSSIPLDWYARRYVELHLNFHILNCLPIPSYGESALHCRVVEISGRLAAVDERYQAWADEVGVPVGSVTDPAQKQDLIGELDALVSLLYGLTADQIEHIYATFHRGWDFRPRLAAVLEHFRAWEERS